MIDTASAIIGPVEAKDTNVLPVIRPDPVPIVLRGNGRDRMLQVEPQMTLAEALRGPVGLTGTKIACNRGACSACVV
jgi:xanthine dehydrogenase YagT iron-sulfur-binding subunit